MAILQPGTGNREPGTRGAAAAAFALGVLVIAAAAGLLLRGQEVRDARQREERRLLAEARAMAHATVRQQGDLAAGRLALHLAKTRAALPGLAALQIVAEPLDDPLSFRRRERILAHSDPELSGLALDRRRDQDKRLHDTRTRVLHRTRLGSYPVGPALLEDQLVDGADGLEIVIAGRREAADPTLSVHLTARRQASPGTIPWLPLFAAACGGIAIFLAFSWSVPRSRGTAAVLLLLAMSAASWYAVVVAYRQHSQQAEQQLAAAAQEAGLRAISALPVAERQPEALARDLSAGFAGEADGVWEVRTGGAALEVLPAAGAAPRAEQRAAAALVPFLILALLIYALGATGRLARAGRALVDHAAAYAYSAPAMTGMLVLVFMPFIVGIGLSFFRHSHGEYSFIGFDNFAVLLAASEYAITEPLNFYFTLGVTVLWTTANVLLHVTLGLGLALILKDPFLRLKGIYRVLLIVPWAVPNYVTALIWKGMFNQQFGAVNALLALVGVGGDEGVSWFSSFAAAFTANLVTNTWLGFPFMMVVSLGALQSLPSDLYEAADVDGASAWHKFRKITLPLLKPALFPALILGSIWTFNQFNIIYLVSAGEPSGATDILITEAYRWAFERGDRYGYAAAYSTVIFVILLVYTLITNRITRATESAYR